MNTTIQSLLSLITIGCLLPATGASVSIGVIRSSGGIRVDGSLIRGNGTLLDGTVVETIGERSDIELSGGARVTLAPGSRARIYHDRTVLENGVGIVRNVQTRAVDARNLRITPDLPNGVLQVAVNTGDHVVVAAQMGAADVRTLSGALVGRVLAGTALDFNPQAGAASGLTRLTGCLVSKTGTYLLTDSTTNVTVEIQGPKLAKFAGYRVQVTGSVRAGASPAPGADQLVLADKIFSVGRCSDVAGTAPSGSGGPGAGAGAGAGAGGIGLSPIAVVAIVGGVAVAATVGGLAAAGGFSGASSVSP